MLRRLVTLEEFPFTPRDYQRYGIETLSERWDVKVLDCVTRSMSDIRENLAAVSFAIDRLGESWRAYRVRRELRKRGIPRVMANGGLVPRLSPSRIPRFWERSVEVVMRTGLAEPLRGSVRTVDSHSLDYDRYLEERKEPVLEPKPYAVFLDESLSTHPDYVRMGKRFPVGMGYFETMNRFFKQLQRAGLMVRVAIHPRTEYHQFAVPAYKGDTPRLVRHASLVLAHQSTSLSFAVLWRKPVISLTTDELLGSVDHKRIALCSRLLDTPLLNVDRDQYTEIPRVCEQSYMEYQRQFVKVPGSPERPSWEILADALCA